MKAVFTIAKKELRSYFYSPMAYAVIAAFLLLNGFLFAMILAALSRPGAGSTNPTAVFFGGTLFYWIFMIIAAPVITMKLGAEEMKTGTIETLLTAPVSDVEVVLGKYLGAMGLYIAIWLPTLVYVAVLRSYTKVDMGPVWGGYIGILLVGLFFIAVGLFASLASRNQVVAAMIGFVILLSLLLISLLAFISSTPFWKGIFDYLDLYTMVQTCARGAVDSRGIVYMLSGAAFFLALSYQALQTRRLR